MKVNEAPETYPMQFKDKIDEYLWKEHNILGGCCSSTESMKYAVAKEVAEKLTNAFIEKACAWLKSRAEYSDYTWYDEFEHESGITDKCIKDFRKYMKGE